MSDRYHPYDACTNCEHAFCDHDEEAEGDFQDSSGVCSALIDPENNGACGCPGFKPAPTQIFNQTAYDKMREAELVYLKENGWDQQSGLDSWSNQMLRRYHVTQGHAVNIQKQRDRRTLQFGSYGS